MKKPFWIFFLLFWVAFSSAPDAGSARGQKNSCGDWCAGAYWQHLSYAQMRADLDNGANPMARGENGVTPLHFAASKPSQYAKTLLKFGAQFDVRDENGNQPIHFAAINKVDIQTLEIFLDYGANIHAQNQQGWTPIHWWAALDGQKAMLPVLLRNGAAINARAYDGKTPLHLAANNVNQKALMVLAQYGADPNLVDHSGRRAEDIIRRNKKLAGATFWQKLQSIWGEMSLHQKSGQENGEK